MERFCQKHSVFFESSSGCDQCLKEKIGSKKISQQKDFKKIKFCEKCGTPSGIYRYCDACAKKEENMQKCKEFWGLGWGKDTREDDV